MTLSGMAWRPDGVAAAMQTVVARPATRRSSTLFAALAGAALLVGCQNFGHQAPPPAQPLQIETGSRLTLSMPLVFPAGVTTLYLQDNQRVSFAQITRAFPYCRLTRTSAATSQTIQPATFTVESVDYDDREIGTTGQPLNVTHLRLVADSNYTLSCLWPEGGPSRNFLTSMEIQGAVGAYFSMVLVR